MPASGQGHVASAALAVALPPSSFHMLPDSCCQVMDSAPELAPKSQGHVSGLTGSFSPGLGRLLIALGSDFSYISQY